MFHENHLFYCRKLFWIHYTIRPSYSKYHFSHLVISRSWYEFQKLGRLSIALNGFASLSFCCLDLSATENGFFQKFSSFRRSLNRRSLNRGSANRRISVPEIFKLISNDTPKPHFTIPSKPLSGKFIYYYSLLPFALLFHFHFSLLCMKFISAYSMA